MRNSEETVRYAGTVDQSGPRSARYQTREIIDGIKERGGAQSLNRGLSLSLPYFDDQELKMATYHFVVIPAGQIIVRSVVCGARSSREEEAKVDQDTRFNASTREASFYRTQIIGRRVCIFERKVNSRYEPYIFFRSIIDRDCLHCPADRTAENKNMLISMVRDRSACWPRWHSLV